MLKQPGWLVTSAGGSASEADHSLTHSYRSPLTGNVDAEVVNDSCYQDNLRTGARNRHDRRRPDKRVPDREPEVISPPR